MSNSKVRASTHDPVGDTRLPKKLPVPKSAPSKIGRSHGGIDANNRTPQKLPQRSNAQKVTTSKQPDQKTPQPSASKKDDDDDGHDVTVEYPEIVMEEAAKPLESLTPPRLIHSESKMTQTREEESKEVAGSHEDMTNEKRVLESEIRELLQDLVVPMKTCSGAEDYDLENSIVHTDCYSFDDISEGYVEKKSSFRCKRLMCAFLIFIPVALLVSLPIVFRNLKKEEPSIVTYLLGNAVFAVNYLLTVTVGSVYGMIRTLLGFDDPDNNNWLLMLL